MASGGGVATLLAWAATAALVAASEARAAGDGDSLYFYDQRQNGTYNIQIHLKDVEVLALLSAGENEYDDSYDDYSYEYHDPVETPYKPTTGSPEAANSTAPGNATAPGNPTAPGNATSPAANCDSPSTTASTPGQTTATLGPTTATPRPKTDTPRPTTAAPAPTPASARRRCRPGYTRRAGGGCKRTAPGGRPLIPLPSPMGFFLRMFLHLFISGFGLVIGRDGGSAGSVSAWHNATQVT